VAFTVDLAGLLDLVDQMEKFDKTVAETCKQVQQSVAALHVSWEGAAAEQQRQAHALWEKGTAEMTEALRQLRSDVATAHRNYDRAFAAGRAIWDGMLGRCHMAYDVDPHAYGKSSDKMVALSAAVLNDGGLSGPLSGQSGMAGSDDAAKAFADGYDKAAPQALTAMNNVASTYFSAAQLLCTTVHNYAQADADSTPSGGHKHVRTSAGEQ
jgi:WXG100 family type VII secretion target